MSNSSIMESLFQRSLEQLIKGFRDQLIGESAFISRSTDEIRREIRSTDPLTKSTALQKLSYLSSLLGVDDSWAAFHVVEVMSSPRFSEKRVGYDAATRSFSDSTPVLLLITNQLRKDLGSNNEYEVSLALQCLSQVASLDLARDLTNEVFTLLGSSKVYVRKRAVCVLLRVFEKYPDAVRVCFKRLVENLESSDPQVASAVIGVFCELAAKDPKSYLPLAPEFYRVLVDSKNNWVLIKVLKVFAKLAVLEPRLAKRIVEPVCEHMRRTGAKSLMFECVRTVMGSLADFEDVVKIAVLKIRELLVDEDPNLKYLGLQALALAVPRHLWAVLENKEVVIKSLSDDDPNVKIESLRLVMAMVSESNVVEISRVLVNYALKSDPEFSNLILGSILSTCCKNVYEIIMDFDWYVSLLGEMARIPNCHKGEEIENQLIDIGMRVRDVRPELVRVGRDLLIDPALLGDPFLHRILCAAAWVSGEYVEFSKNPFELMEALLQPRTSLLSPPIMAVYIQSAFKVLIFCLHSYLLQKESAASVSHPNNLAPGVLDLASGVQSLESFDSATYGASSHFQQLEGINSNLGFENALEEYSGDANANQFLASTFSVEKNGLTHESIGTLFSIMESALDPLLGSSDVEIQERVRNVLGFVELIKQEMTSGFVQDVENSERSKTQASNIIEILWVSFSEELGPVSVSAHARVSIPDGLMLKENLGDLEMICGDIELPPLNSFSLGSTYGERVGDSNFQSDEELEPMNKSESTSLLAEHRKRHGLFYLPSEKNGTVSNEYPPANVHSSDIINEDAENLVKLTGQSLVPKKKSNQSKPRPVVVKLDGDEVPSAAKKLGPKDDLLSGAVRDILLGNEAIPASLQSNMPAKSSSKIKGKEILNTDLPLRTQENLGEEKPDHGNPSSRRKHRSHGKERRHKSSGKRNTEETEGDGQKAKEKSDTHHSRHKSRQRSDKPVNVVPQTSVIPDFLL